MRYSKTILGIMIMTTLLFACQAVEPQTAVPASQDTQPQIDTPGLTSEGSATQDLVPTLNPEETEMVAPITPGASTDQIIKLVKQHLAQTLGITADQIVLSDIKPVLWRDAGLGCPKPGVDYIQMETPGYNILLEAGGKTYRYHTDEVKRFVLCNR